MLIKGVLCVEERKFARTYAPQRKEQVSFGKARWQRVERTPHEDFRGISVSTTKIELSTVSECPLPSCLMADSLVRSVQAEGIRRHGSAWIMLLWKNFRLALSYP